ncbi:hypothetical protein AMJ80_06455 [bacterium SM23_31]|nr:MAG: hypothetical protein AMJ80_06455 [bacterium SM23_31]
MNVSIFQDQLRMYRLWKSFLLSERKGPNVHDIIRHFVALNASNIQDVYIALYNRMRHFSKHVFEEYLYKSGNAGRFRGMRRVFYIVPREFFELFFSATFRQREYKIKENLKLWKIQESEYTNIARQILKAIAYSEKTQPQLEKAVVPQDMRTIKIDYGKRRITGTNFEPVFNTLLDRWQVIPGVEIWNTKKRRYCSFDKLHEHHRFSMDYDTAGMELVLNYIKNYGPVQEEDVAWWCGLTISRIQRILVSLANDIRKVEIVNSKKIYYVLKKEIPELTSKNINPGESCHLLGRNDPLLTGYRRRDVHVNQDYYDSIFSGFGESNPAVMVNGKIIGIWSFKDSKSSINLAINLFQKISAGTEDKLCMEIERIGDFIGGEDKTSNVEIIYK